MNAFDCLMEKHLQDDAHEPDPRSVFALLAELLARQDGREAKDIVVRKKGESES